jgi:hypothetical protein
MDNEKSRLSRREFIKLAGLTSTAAALGACTSDSTKTLAHAQGESGTSFMPVQIAPASSPNGTATNTPFATGTPMPTGAPRPTPDVSPTLFIDSVNGDDNNNGLSPDTAFSTIARGMTYVGKNSVIGLARGSHFREHLFLDRQGVTVIAYGEGPRPILDASDQIRNASFDKTASAANVFEIQLRPQLDQAKTWINVWEDDRYLIRAASIEACDRTPGSCFPSADTGSPPIMLYVHPLDSSDPTSNGKKYEYAARQYGIYSPEKLAVIGIETRRNLHENGSTKVGRYSLLQDCLFREGSKHNVFVGTGAQLIDCQAIDAYYAGQSAAMYVYNANSPQGEGITFINCLAFNSTEDTRINGFFGHKNIAGSFGTVRFIRCITQQLNLGFSGTDAETIIFNHCQSIDNVIGYSVGRSRETWLNNCSHQGVRGINIVRAENSSSATYVESFLCRPTGPNSQAVNVDANGQRISLKNCLFLMDTGPDQENLWAVQLRGEDVVAELLDNSYVGFNFGIYSLSTGVQLNSDRNCFSPFSRVRTGEQDYVDFRQYQSQTGQDKSSMAGSCATGQ